MEIRIPFLPARRIRARLDAHRPAMLRVAFSWCHDQALAEDLVQDAMVKALSQAASLRDADKLKSWLFVILGNRFRDHLRSARPFVDIDSLDEQVLAGGPQPDEIHQQAQVVARVRAAIAALPLGQRTAITLVDIEGFAYAEVAIILDIPVGTVMSRLSRGRAALRELLLEKAADLPAAALRSVK